MATYSKPLPQRAPDGPFVIPDEGCWYPWPFWPPGPVITPGYTPPPTATPDPNTIPQATPDPYIPQATPDPYVPRVPPPPPIASPTPPSSAPQGNPVSHEVAHWLGFSDGRKGAWRPDRFTSQSDRAQYRMGWKQGQQSRRFVANPKKRFPHLTTQPTKSAPVPHSTILKPHY